MVKREDIAVRTIDTLKGLVESRVDSYEIFFSTESGLSVEVRDGGVDALKARSSSGVGLRTLTGAKQGFGFTSVVTEAALAELASNTVDGSLEASEDEFLVFAAPAAPPTPVRAAGAEGMDLVDEDYSSGTEQEKIEFALEIERSAREYDRRVVRVRKASYQESVRTTRVVNSNGVDASHRATYFSASVMAVADMDGESQIGWEMDTSHKKGALDFQRIGEMAGHNAVRMLGAKSIDTVRCPAVIENTVVCELLGSLAPSFLADNVHKGKSMLIGRLDERVASGVLNVWDDGLLSGGWASSVFDGEGIPRQKTPLLKEGVLTGYLYDSYWAARASATSTGNAARSGFKNMPSVGTSNLYIEKGEKGLDELLSGMESGLFITEVMGAHTVNTVNGDFSVGASGLLVKGGKIVNPVRGLAISGNLLELFSAVEACATDIRFIGSVGAPSIYIGGVEASGT